jgi:hypothetical protein
MRNFLKLLILVPALLLPACNGEGEGADGGAKLPARVDLGRAFEIGYGKTVLVDDIAIEFTAVVEESRCPIDAVCVWNGNARILVTANRGGNHTHPGARALAAGRDNSGLRRSRHPVPRPASVPGVGDYPALAAVLCGHAVRGWHRHHRQSLSATGAVTPLAF